MNKYAFLICPVRGHDPDELVKIVKDIESQGYILHYPPRDTNQDDPTGYQICCDNFKAICKSNKVFVVWDGKSQGCLFDLGIAFALSKSIKIIDIPPLTEGKSFQNMIKDWEENGLVRWSS